MGRRCAFVEFKRRNGRIRPAQKEVIAELRLRGCLVFIVRNPEQFDEVIRALGAKA